MVNADPEAKPDSSLANQTADVDIHHRLVLFVRRLRDGLFDLDSRVVDQYVELAPMLDGVRD